MKYPNVLNKTEKEKWPKNISIDVVIPENDQWVNMDGQRKLVAKVLRPLLGKKVHESSVQGGHLPLGKDDSATMVADMISRAG